MHTQTLLVGDLMTIDPIVVSANAPVEEAARLVHAYSVSGLPVVDEAGSLVGVISQTDLLAIHESAIGRLIRAQSSGLRVGEIMSAPAITIPMAGSLRDAAKSMRDSHVHRLVAVDDAGCPVGVISASDFVALYADE